MTPDTTDRTIRTIARIASVIVPLAIILVAFPLAARAEPPTVTTNTDGCVLSFTVNDNHPTAQEHNEIVVYDGGGVFVETLSSEGLGNGNHVLVPSRSPMCAGEWVAMSVLTFPGGDVQTYDKGRGVWAGDVVVTTTTAPPVTTTVPEPTTSVPTPTTEPPVTSTTQPPSGSSTSITAPPTTDTTQPGTPTSIVTSTTIPPIAPCGDSDGDGIDDTTGERCALPFTGPFDEYPGLTIGALAALAAGLLTVVGFANRRGTHRTPATIVGRWSR